MTRLLLLLLTLLFSLSGSVMGEYSDFGRSPLAAKNAPNIPINKGAAANSLDVEDA